jgi:hypothetical protein
LIAYTNPNTVIELFDAKENESIAEYDGVDEVPDEYSYCEIADIFVDGNKLCVEISLEDFDI